MAAKEPIGAAIGQRGTPGKRLDLATRLDLRQLQRGGEGAAGAVEQLGNLELARVQIEPARAATA